MILSYEGEGNPLELVKENKRFVAWLRKNGLDDLEVKNRVADTHGELPVQIFLKITEELRKPLREKQRFKKNLETAKKMLGALLNLDNPVFSDDEKKVLQGLYDAAERKWQCFYGSVPSRGISPQRLLGLRTVELYNYIFQFMKNDDNSSRTYRKQDIYKLIAELFEVAEYGTYTDIQIKDWYRYNK